jgi:hypothetical protein
MQLSGYLSPFPGIENYTQLKITHICIRCVPQRGRASWTGVDVLPESRTHQKCVLDPPSLGCTCTSMMCSPCTSKMCSRFASTCTSTMCSPLGNTSLMCIWCATPKGLPLCGNTSSMCNRFAERNTSKMSHPLRGTDKRLHME